MFEPGQEVIWEGDNQKYTIDSLYTDPEGRINPGLIILCNEIEAERVVRVEEIKPCSYSGGSTMKPKCQQEGCYNPSDCKHGYCGEHCPSEAHQLGGYSTRSYPRSDRKYIGVELEVEFNSRRDLKRGIAAYGGHHDASLGEYSAEYKMLRPATTICKYAANMAEELWKLKAKVTRACGFHVHIDARRIRSLRIAELFHWAHYTQDHWYKLMPQSRRDNTQYVCKLSQSVMTSDEFLRPGALHHCWINYSPYSTVEIRLHSSTLNPYKIQGWLTALIHLQSKLYDSTFSFDSAMVKDPTPKKVFWKVFEDCPILGSEYLKTREASDGVIRDYAFSSLNRNEEEVRNV